MLGRPPSVDPLDSLARVGRVGRAGYCFHQNGALETALLDLGYSVSRRGGHVWTTERRPVVGEPEPPRPGRLRACRPTTTPAAEWWPDVGLGDAIVEPLPLAVGDYEQGGFTYAITEVRDDGWSFRADRQGSFLGLETGPAPTADRRRRLPHGAVDAARRALRARCWSCSAGWPTTSTWCAAAWATAVTPDGQSERELTTYDDWRGAIADGCGLSLAGVERRRAAGAVRPAARAAPRRSWRPGMSDDLLDIADELYGLRSPTSRPRATPRPRSSRAPTSPLRSRR